MSHLQPVKPQQFLSGQHETPKLKVKYFRACLDLTYFVALKNFLDKLLQRNFE